MLKKLRKGVTPRIDGGKFRYHNPDFRMNEYTYVLTFYEDGTVHCWDHCAYWTGHADFPEKAYLNSHFVGVFEVRIGHLVQNFMFSSATVCRFLIQS